MSKLHVLALFAVSSAETLLDYGLSVARIAGLPVDTWRAGDPTRVGFKYLAETLATLEGTVAEYIKAGFLSEARGDWLTILAREVYGVERVEATYASTPITVVNSGGGHFELAAGDLIVRNTATDKTYRNDAPIVIAAGATVTVDVTADEAGTDANAGENEIDEIVAPGGLDGVAITASAAAFARYEQSDESLVEQCEATRGALSPNGPADAYEYVARNPELTWVSDVTRAKAVDDSDTGDVLLYVAGPSGAVGGASVSAVDTACRRWARPLALTLTTQSADGVPVDVTAELEGVDIP